MSPSGRVAIVTGASSGIGEAITHDLVSKGWIVAMADIQPNAQSATEPGESDATFFQCNVADYDSQAGMFQKVWDNSLFIFDYRDSVEIPPKPDTSCTDVDYKGVIYGTQLAIHFMRKNTVPGGMIVATGSAAAIIPHETYPEYDGAKAAVGAPRDQRIGLTKNQAVNFVRAMARVLKNKENISINVVLPGIVHTKIIPQAMIDAVSPECLTPVSTIVSAYNRFLEDGSLYGKAIECSADKHIFIDTPSLGNGSVSQRAVTVWDPLFNMYHHESSGLPDAIG